MKKKKPNLKTDPKNFLLQHNISMTSILEEIYNDTKVMSFEQSLLINFRGKIVTDIFVL